MIVEKMLVGYKMLKNKSTYIFCFLILSIIYVTFFYYSNILIHCSNPVNNEGEAYEYFDSTFSRQNILWSRGYKSYEDWVKSDSYKNRKVRVYRFEEYWTGEIEASIDDGSGGEGMFSIRFSPCRIVDQSSELSQ